MARATHQVGVVPLKLLLPLWIVCSPALGLAASLVIDDFAYTNSARARSAWVNTGAPAVSMATGGDWGADEVMVLTCDFATRNTRCIWDRSVALNLAAYAEFELEVYAPNPAPISSLTLYFRSGSGWYGASVALKQGGWQTLRFGVGDFIPEGSPTGWSQIHGIRLSPWKASAENTSLAVRQLRAVTPAVLLVRDTQSSNPEVVQQTIDRHSAWFGGYSVHCGVITRAGVEAGLLQHSRIAILPYNEAVSEAEMTQYESFVAGGGKLIVYYLLPGRLPALMGVRVTGWTRGDFAAWLFSDPTITNLPARVAQASWNITLAEPNGTLNSRISARWEDQAGQDTGKAAWIASEAGFFMSHILLADDGDAKSYALLCLVGSLLDEVWPSAATGALDQMGRVGPYVSYGRAVEGIRNLAAATLRAVQVESELRAAETNRAQAWRELSAGRYSLVISAANSARAYLRKAYALSLKPVFPEFRAIWEHDATGPYPGNWPAAIETLVTNGLNAIFPNMLWGGLAHYDSAVLPHSAEFSQYGDQVAACVAAARARNVQVHVWKVNWNLLGAPQHFIDELRAANRTQVSRTGSPIDWLCPSHPDNFALETNAMLEIVRNYDVDGIHFDYIRYPGPDYCYCAGCGNRFQSQTGRTVVNWPGDVLVSGALRNAFLDWRRAQITRLVETVYSQTKLSKPKVQVSAAVFPNAPSAYDEVGQDWRLWVTNGILDFVCPMDYTTELHSFTNLAAQQSAWVTERMPVYPGIGAFVLEPDQILAQVEATRALNTSGFILFELSPGSASTLLPVLHAGATALDEPDADRDLLPDAWELHWFSSLASAGFNSDADGDGLADLAEYVAGTNPAEGAGDLRLKAEQRQAGIVFISFVARGADGPGYHRVSRHYCLEGTASPGSNDSWAAVPGFADHVALPGETPMSYSAPAELDAACFYRLRVWLQAP